MNKLSNLQNNFCPFGLSPSNQLSAVVVIVQPGPSDDGDSPGSTQRAPPQMIHRFLLFDKNFNCRLDRFYPLSAAPATAADGQRQRQRQQASHSVVANEQVATSGGDVVQYGNWQILQMEEMEKQITNSNTIRSNNHNGNAVHNNAVQLPLALSMESTASAAAATVDKTKQVEHSQKLLLGAAHSLRNMLLKLSPQPQTETEKPVLGGEGSGAAAVAAEGYAFTFRTSTYRVHYFESFTGYRLLLLEGASTPAATSAAAAAKSLLLPAAMAASAGPSTVATPYGPVTADSCLRVLYAELIAGYGMHYPLGNPLAFVSAGDAAADDDAFNRAGFLTRLDEYIQSIDKLF